MDSLFRVALIPYFFVICSHFIVPAAVGSGCMRRYDVIDRAKFFGFLKTWLWMVSVFESSLLVSLIEKHNIIDGTFFVANINHINKA